MTIIAMRHVARRSMLVAFVCFSASSARAQVDAPKLSEPVADARIDRIELWVKAVASHRPGGMDEAANAIAAWPNGDLQALWIEITNLVALMRKPALNHFVFKPPGGRVSVLVSYKGVQLARLRALACASAGILLDDHTCVNVSAADSIDNDLKALAARAAESRRSGDPNYLVKRGALMHSDVAMAGPLPTTAIDQRPSLAPQSFLMRMSDGQPQDLGQAAIHWEIARMLLDDVRPSGADKPSPASDEMVRLWYRATAAWMQKGEHLNRGHLDRGRTFFPKDADILFLLGCLHETFADAQVQGVVRSAVLPTGVVMDMLDERTELKAAEELLKAAVDVRPEFAEARLRLGRVLALRGRYPDAISELRLALQTLPADPPELRYYGELFLGGAEEGASHFNESRAAYERASALFPLAQSPFMGLSELARRRGDRVSSLAAMQKVFALPPVEGDRVDPWWTYHVIQARDADTLLAALWKPYR